MSMRMCVIVALTVKTNVARIFRPCGTNSSGLVLSLQIGGAMRIKYISYETPDGLITMVMFPEIHDHSTMAWALTTPGKIVGAGFVEFMTKEPYCYGKSTSLNTEMAKGDTALLKRFLTND